jgi:hypothetical protein
MLGVRCMIVSDRYLDTGNEHCDEIIFYDFT